MMEAEEKMAYLAHREGSILQVTRQSTELESEDHLNNGEVHLPAHVVDVEPINMAQIGRASCRERVLMPV